MNSRPGSLWRDPESEARLNELRAALHHMHMLVMHKMEAARQESILLEELAMHSGAIAGEFRIVWRPCRNLGCSWPALV